MAISATLPDTAPSSLVLDEKLRKGTPGKAGAIAFGLILLGGAIYVVTQLWNDLSPVHSPSVYPYILLGLALLIALGFEFVNGFHDTANAVATVIYTHSLQPNVAVVFSGIMNFVGVLVSSGTVAFAVISLLPVELILKLSRGAGYSMVFALLTAAILWNLATWYKGLPASSSHTMIGSIIGVGIANQLMQGNSGTAGLDWDQVMKVFKQLLLSPAIGFGLAALLFFFFRLLARDERLYRAPEGTAPPPFWIRCLLIVSCGGVSYAHGSNDGQKGMGLIMLILVGTVPTAYALNHAVTAQQMDRFLATSSAMVETLDKYADDSVVVRDDQVELERFVSTKRYEPRVMPALRQMVAKIRNEVTEYKSLKGVPDGMQANVRNQMYLAGETMRLMQTGGPTMSAADLNAMAAYKSELDTSTKFIPTWVKVAVALALGLGTMIGWKRIVVTVGEKIGKTHLTYPQGASAQL